MNFHRTKTRSVSGSFLIKKHNERINERRMMLENIFFASKQRKVDTIVYCIDDRKKSFHVSNNLKKKFFL